MINHVKRLADVKPPAPVVLCERKGLPVIAKYNAGAVKPFCVQFAGNGHFFATLDELRDYCTRREWQTDGLINFR